MTPWPTTHLTADDLDAFHSEALNHEMRLHLETCRECQTLVALDREVLDGLGRLPSLSPRDGFLDRVMARVAIGKPAPVPVLSFPRLTRGRVTALIAAGVGMAASVAWSSVNRPVLDRWLETVGSTVWTRGNLLWQQGFSYLASQPWFDTLRELSSTPLRLAAVSLAVIGLYATGLLALRRLVTPSAGTVSNAGA